MTEPTLADPAPSVPKAMFTSGGLVSVCERCRFEKKHDNHPPVSMREEIDREIIAGLMRLALKHTCGAVDD